MTIEFLFADYKPIDGVKHFTKLIIKADGKEFTNVLSDIKFPKKLPDNLFAKPE